jgi:large subunit ribosomal protein L5
MARLRDRYREDIVPTLQRELGYKNVYQVPKLEKIVVNVGLGEAIANGRALEAAVNDLSIITGQKPVVTRAKKSIASFKLRAGMPIGAMVTLRGERMYEFLDRLVSVALPRIRDFRGISARGFDGSGNFNFGVTEQIIFPEIEYEKVDAVRGMNITITTTAKTDEQGKALLDAFSFPFRK